MSKALRWQFKSYDHRRNGILRSRGWLHYAGVGPVLIAVGFHRGWRQRRPWAWIEITVYLGGVTIDVYPGMRIPESWL